LLSGLRSRGTGTIVHFDVDCGGDISSWFRKSGPRGGSTPCRGPKFREPAQSDLLECRRNQWTGYVIDDAGEMGLEHGELQGITTAQVQYDGAMCRAVGVLRRESIGGEQIAEKRYRLWRPYAEFEGRGRSRGWRTWPVVKGQRGAQQKPCSDELFSLLLDPVVEAEPRWMT